MVIYNGINFIHIGEYLLCFFSLCLSSCPIKGNRSSTKLVSEHSTAHCAIIPLYLRVSMPCNYDLQSIVGCFWVLILLFLQKLSYHSTIIEHSFSVLQVNERVKNSLSLSWSLLKWCMGMKWLPICLQCILTVREFFFAWQAGEIKVVQDKRGSAVICQGTKGSPVWESGCSPERAFRSLTH